MVIPLKLHKWIIPWKTAKTADREGLFLKFPKSNTYEKKLSKARSDDVDNFPLLLSLFFNSHRAIGDMIWVPRFTGKTRITGKTVEIPERPKNNRELKYIQYVYV